MRIKYWQEQERPRERLLAKGAENLSDAELLAIIFPIGRKGESAVEQARRYLRHFGSLRNLFRASLVQFQALLGLTKNRYILLKAIEELSKRLLEQEIPIGELITTSQATKRFFRAKLRDQTREVFVGLFLDTKNHIIAFEELAQGTIDSTVVYIREVVERVLFHHAKNVIFAHNHPSGIATPSQADLDLTVELKEALALFHVNVWDHLIVGSNEIISLAELGKL